MFITSHLDRATQKGFCLVESFFYLRTGSFPLSISAVIPITLTTCIHGPFTKEIGFLEHQASVLNAAFAAQLSKNISELAIKRTKKRLAAPVSKGANEIDGKTDIATLG